MHRPMKGWNSRVFLGSRRGYDGEQNLHGRLARLW